MILIEYRSRSEVAISNISGSKGLPDIAIFRVSESYILMYVSIPNNLVDRFLHRVNEVFTLLRYYAALFGS